MPTIRTDGDSFREATMRAPEGDCSVVTVGVRCRDAGGEGVRKM